MQPDSKVEPVSSQPKVCTFHSVPWIGLVNHVSFVQAIAPMKEVGDKNALKREVDSDGNRDWSFGLFNYFPRCRLCTLDQPITSFGLANPIFRFMGHILPLRHLWAEPTAFAPSAAPKRSPPRRR
jgi:hypothetical protein